VGELQQVPVGIGHQDVLSLAADPAAHVDIAVGAARTVRVDVEADAGLALLAVAAPAAGDVERHRAEVTLLDELHAGPDLDHLTGDLVAEDEILRRRCPASDHVLVRTADVGGHHLEDGPVGHLASHVVWVHTRAVLELELWVGDVLDLSLARAEVGHAAVARHGDSLSRSHAATRSSGHGCDRILWVLANVAQNLTV